MMRAELRVDLGRLERNIDTLRGLIAPADLMVVVKNDAYGHGLEEVVAAAVGRGVTWFGAFDVATGMRVRKVAPQARVFSWLTVGVGEIAEALEGGLDLGVGDADYLESVAAVSAGRGARVHLKIDSGLHRNGVRPEDWDGFVRRAAELERAADIHAVGVWSHIAETSDADDDEARMVFLRAVEAARAAGLHIEQRHLAASAAGYRRPEYRQDLVRFGAFCYGIRSADGPEPTGIEQVATLVAPVTSVDADGVEIDYGALDGLPSTLAGRMSVGTPAGARRVRSIGPASSRVEGWPDAAPGDEIVVFGERGTGASSVTTLAEAIDTVGEEILVRVPPRIPRRYTRS